MTPTLLVRRIFPISAFFALCLLVGLFLVRNRGLLGEQNRLATETRHLRRQLDEAFNRNNLLSRQLSEAETLSRSAPSTAEARRRDLLAKFDDAHLAPLKREPTPPDPSGLRGNLIFPELMDDPGYLGYIQDFYVGLVEKIYGPLLKSLPASTRPRVARLLMDRLLVQYDAEGAASRAGLDLEKDRNEVRRITNKALDVLRDELTALVGENASSITDRLAQISNERSRLLPIVQRLSYSDEPLTPEQTQQFMELAVTPTAKGYSVSLGGLDGILSQTKSVFSPAQWASLEEYARESKASSIH